MNADLQVQQAPPRAAAMASTVAPSATDAGDVACALGEAARRANAGPHASSLAALQAMVAQRACADCETVGRTMGGGAPVQRAGDEDGGLPGELRAGLEALSGRDLSGVRVNYDSPRPAQLNAHAVAQGPVIDVGPGKEKHLAHEGWHAVQQMQNRVRPTMDLDGTPVNDDATLEREADVMGARALAAGRAAQLRKNTLAAPATLFGAHAPVQRVVDMDEFLTNEDRARLFADELNVDDLEEIQELLKSKDHVAALMRELETDTEQQFWGDRSDRKYTTALNLALFNQEKKWMNVADDPAGKDRQKIKADEGQLSNDAFLARVASGKPLKDVGAAISHGEYAHRMQWYMISRALEQNLFAEGEESGAYSEAHPRANEFKWILSKLYAHMADPEYTKMLRGGKLPTASEGERNAQQQDGTPLPLWSAILDVQGSHVDKGAKGEPGLGMFADVFAAAPVKLTGALTYEGVKNPAKGALQEGGMAYSQVSLAVLNRRIKRYLASRDDKTRPDGVMNTALSKLAGKEEDGDKVVRALLDKPKLDYDERNQLAFKLLGIPWD